MDGIASKPREDLVVRAKIVGVTTHLRTAIVHGPMQRQVQAGISAVVSLRPQNQCCVRVSDIQLCSKGSRNVKGCRTALSLGFLQGELRRNLAGFTLPARGAPAANLKAAIKRSPQGGLINAGLAPRNDLNKRQSLNPKRLFAKLLIKTYSRWTQLASAEITVLNRKCITVVYYMFAGCLTAILIASFIRGGAYFGRVSYVAVLAGSIIIGLEHSAAPGGMWMPPMGPLEVPWYPYFDFEDGTYVALPIWMPTAGCLWGAWRARRGLSRSPVNCCQKCGYDRTGNVSGRCPECGLKISLPAAESDTCSPTPQPPR